MIFFKLQLLNFKSRVLFNEVCNTYGIISVLSRAWNMGIIIVLVSFRYYLITYLIYRREFHSPPSFSNLRFFSCHFFIFLSFFIKLLLCPWQRYEASVCFSSPSFSVLSHRSFCFNYIKCYSGIRQCFSVENLLSRYCLDHLYLSLRRPRIKFTCVTCMFSYLGPEFWGLCFSYFHVIFLPRFLILFPFFSAPSAICASSVSWFYVLLSSVLFISIIKCSISNPNYISKCRTLSSLFFKFYIRVFYVTLSMGSVTRVPELERLCSFVVFLSLFPIISIPVCLYTIVVPPNVSPLYVPISWLSFHLHFLCLVCSNNCLALYKHAYNLCPTMPINCLHDKHSLK